MAIPADYHTLRRRNVTGPQWSTFHDD